MKRASADLLCARSDDAGSACRRSGVLPEAKTPVDQYTESTERGVRAKLLDPAWWPRVT